MCPIGLGCLPRLLVEQEEAASFPPGLLQAPHHVGIRFDYPGLRLAPEPRGQEGRGPEAALDPVEGLGGGRDAGTRGVEREWLLTEGEAVGGIGVQPPDQLRQTFELTLESGGKPEVGVLDLALRNARHQIAPLLRDLLRNEVKIGILDGGAFVGPELERRHAKDVGGEIDALLFDDQYPVSALQSHEESIFQDDIVAGDDVELSPEFSGVVLREDQDGRVCLHGF